MRVFIVGYVRNVKSQFFFFSFKNRAGWRLGLTTWLSREFKLRANWMARLDFCPVVLQLAWLLSSLACSVRVHLLAACKPQVSTSLHNLEHFFTLFYTLPLHDSHLNTGFLSVVLQVNLSWNKANTWLIKFNLTISLSFFIFEKQELSHFISYK